MKAEITINFSNPIEEKFLSAQANVYVKGSAEVSGLDNGNLAFKIHQEKAKVMKFMPYFQSDT